MGYKDTGFLLLAWSKVGGYYLGATCLSCNRSYTEVFLDTGASQLIVDGKIKLKNDSPIQEFTENGIKFENGSFLAADVVICATG